MKTLTRISRLARQAHLGMLASAALSFASAGFYLSHHWMLGSSCMSLATTWWLLSDNDTEED